MKKERKVIQLTRLRTNNGQLPWLPKNPRQWKKEDVDKTIASIKRDPDFLEDRPALVLPLGDDGYIVFAGNLRTTASKATDIKGIPCIVYTPETDDDRETIKRRAVLDNGSFGSWDYDLLANEWDDLPLADWGVPSWNADLSDMGLTTKGREQADGYQEFVDKFDEELPVTTDDCYTPAEVYDTILSFVDKNVTPITGRKIVRPFFPGGNYEDMTQYPPGCIVLDNPPFSIYAKIVRFYEENKIPFFLFGPQLSLFVSGADVCFLPLNCNIVYENGAKVNTGFVTNMIPGIRIKCIEGLKQEIARVQHEEPTTPVYDYPAEVISSALLGKIGSNTELEILSTEASYVHNLDGFREIDKGLFGGGFLLSTAAAEKARAAAEKARAAAEKARAVKIELSEKEQAIVKALDEAANI